MRLLQLIGLILVIGGVVVLWKRPSYTTSRNVLEIGDLKATMHEERGIPPWIGAAAIGGGVVLLMVGRRRA
jgi:hypothetical protein